MGLMKGLTGSPLFCLRQCRRRQQLASQKEVNGNSGLCCGVEGGYGVIWGHMGSYGVIWGSMGIYVSQCIPMGH